MLRKAFINQQICLDLEQSTAVACGIFPMFFQKFPKLYAFCYFMILQRENLRASEMLHYTSNQIQLPFFKNKNKASKKQKILDVHI